MLTSSTSEAYSLLFKLLCAPSGTTYWSRHPAIRCSITSPHWTVCVRVRTRSQYHGRWELDVESVDDAWTGSTRAALAVSPNNPTGSL